MERLLQEVASARQDVVAAKQEVVATKQAVDGIRVVIFCAVALLAAFLLNLLYKASSRKKSPSGSGQPGRRPNNETAASKNGFNAEDKKLLGENLSVLTGQISRLDGRVSDMKSEFVAMGAKPNDLNMRIERLGSDLTGIIQSQVSPLREMKSDVDFVKREVISIKSEMRSAKEAVQVSRPEPDPINRMIDKQVTKQPVGSIADKVTELIGLAVSYANNTETFPPNSRAARFLNQLRIELEGMKSILDNTKGGISGLINPTSRQPIGELTTVFDAPRLIELCDVELVAESLCQKFFIEVESVRKATRETLGKNGFFVIRPVPQVDKVDERYHEVLPGLMQPAPRAGLLDLVSSRTRIGFFTRSASGNETVIIRATVGKFTSAVSGMQSAQAPAVASGQLSQGHQKTFAGEQVTSDSEPSAPDTQTTKDGKAITQPSTSENPY